MNNASEKANSVDHSSHVPQFIGPALTLIAGIILSVSVFSLVRSWEKSELHNLFEFSAHNRLTAFQTDLISHEEVVSSIASLFSSSEHVTRKEFHSFVQGALSRQPTIHGLGWNPLIKTGQQKNYIEQARNDGISDFHITEFGSEGQIVEATNYDNAVIIYYIEPYSGNEKAMGFNIASHPGRLHAIQQARDTGNTAITESIKLVQQKEKESNIGYLLLKAIYQHGENVSTVTERREHFLGLATGVFLLDDWLPLSMKNLPPVGMDILILDKSAPMDNQFLYFHSSRTRDETIVPTQQYISEASEGLHWQATVDVFGRQWSFLFIPAPAFHTAHQSWQAWTILIAGFSFTFMLTFYLLSRVRHTARMLGTNVALLHEVTERKANESELKAQIDFVDTVLDAASNIIVVLDLEGRFVRFNRAAEELTGFSFEEVLDKPVWKIVIPEEQKSGVETIFNHLKNGQVEVASQYENEWLTHDGGRCLLQWHNSVLRDENGKVSHIVAMGYDITDREKIEKEHKRLQDELQQSHKMDSLGQLTGGIAHDFNNLLGVINGYASLIFERYENKGDEKLVNYANHIKTAGNRAADLVSQMLAFSRSSQIEDSPVQLGPLLKEDIKMLRATLPSTIDIKTDIEPSLPNVVINPIHLHQILMNLSINARDAMQEVGQLTITLGWARGLKTVSPVSHKPVTGDWIELCVSDNGSGIDAETAINMFNPFYTTKEVGKGTGMGLSVIYGIMESLGGHILLDSELGKGSSFRMLFPSTTEAHHETMHEHQASIESTKGDGSEILLVDDEVSLGSFMSELLEHNGYKTLLVTDSTDALTVFQNKPNRFSILITDQTMPVMTGIELIEKIRKIRPELPVILCSGNVDRVNSNKATEMNITLFEKPINGQQLLLKIAALLKSA